MHLWRSWWFVLLISAAVCGQELTPLKRTGARPRRATVQATLNVDALEPGQQAALAVVLDVAEGFHAQSNKPLKLEIPLTVKMEDNPAVKWLDPIYPPGELVEYPVLGKASIHTGRVIVYVLLEVKPDAPPGPIKLAGSIRYQICDDKQCFFPETTKFEVPGDIVPRGSAAQVQPTPPTRGGGLNRAEVFKAFDPAIFARSAPASAPAAKAVTIFGLELKENARLLPFALAFVIGIIFNVVPCVLPVVPLKAMSFYQVAQQNRAKSLALGTVFGAGIVATFAVLGLFVVVLKRLAWGELFGNPWLVGGIVVLLTIFAFSMFGTFSVLLPQGVYRFAPRHDTYLGNFLFGILTAVLSTPCTFGMFLLLLVWAATQPPAIALGIVMQVGAGMAFPYIVLSAFPELARRMPRTGPWAELVKQMMGFLLLLSAAYFARRFIEGWVGADTYWWTLFAIVAVAAAFLVIRTIQFSPNFTARLAAAVIAAILVLPTGLFAYRITHPPIEWVDYTPEVLDNAKKAGPVMVEFTAAWCGNCLALEATVFHDEQVAAAIRQKKTTAIRVDLTSETAPGWKLLKDTSAVGAIPLTIIYPRAGGEPIQLPGVYSSGDLIAALEMAAR